MRPVHAPTGGLPAVGSFAVRPARLRHGLRRAAFASIRERRLVGLSRFELLTPRLSSVCSNQLSYRPQVSTRAVVSKSPGSPGKPLQGLSAVAAKRRRILSKLDRTRNPSCTRSIFSSASALAGVGNSRKEVIQPQVLLQLPCYDFTPITDHTLGACLPCGLAQRLLVQPAFVM